jgi:hypothetical protein
MPRRLFRFERGFRIAWILNREEVPSLAGLAATYSSKS